MISTHARRSTAAEHCDSVRHQLEHIADPDTLIVCLGNSETHGFYFPPVDCREPLVLKIDGTSLNEAVDAINLVLDSTNVRTMLICSHSQTASLGEFSPQTDTPPSFVRGVMESQNRMNQSKKQFTETISKLKKDLSEHPRDEGKRPSIVGFFYLVESNMFLVLDDETGTLQPLAPVTTF